MLTPNHLREASGLTPRQVNDWDSRGALPNDREAERAHRRFTPQQVFAISVCAQFRRDFGVPVERLSFLRDWLLDDEDEGMDYLNYAARLMTEHGVGVWVLTDFTETVLVATEMELADIWAGGFFGADNMASYAFVNVNPIVNKVLVAIGRSPIESHERYRDLVRAVRDSDRARPHGERKVLNLIRSGQYQSVEVISPDGKAITIRATEHFAPGADLRAILDEADNQVVTTTKRRGKVTGTQRTMTIKPGADKASGTSRE